MGFAAITINCSIQKYSELTFAEEMDGITDIDEQDVVENYSLNIDEKKLDKEKLVVLEMCA